MIWPNKVVEDRARRRCVLYLGAGVSKNSRNERGESPKLWLEFLNDALDRCAVDRSLAKSLIRKNDLLTACYVIKSAMGQADWLDYVEDEFLRAGFRAADIHRSIYDLDAPIILTTNFDKIYDTHATTFSDGQVKVKTYYSDDLAREIRGGSNSRLIIKAHGTIDSPQRLIFSRDDYSRLMNDSASFVAIIRALLITNSFLFLGCGAEDPDISLFLESYARTFKVGTPHYFVTHSPQMNKLEKFFIDNYSLKLIKYDGRDGHEELTSGIKELVALVQMKRRELAQTETW